MNDLSLYGREIGIWQARFEISDLGTACSPGRFEIEDLSLWRRSVR
jgi:hypothetical protein